MEIEFKTKKLKRACEDFEFGKKQWGKEITKKVIQRLSEIKAAQTGKDLNYLPPTRFHKLTGKRLGQYAVDLKHPYRLIFIPINDDGIHVSVSNSSEIIKIKILEVTDYHG